MSGNSAAGAPNHHSPVLVATSSTEPPQHPIAALANQPLYEMPLSATYNESPYGQETSPPNWNYDTKDWQSPVDPGSSGKDDFSAQRYNLTGSQYGTYDISEGMDQSMAYPLLDNYSGPTPFEAVQGLPFSGLGFLQTYDGNGIEPAHQEAWSNNLPPGGFEMAPEFSFASLLDVAQNMTPNYDDFGTYHSPEFART
jgi:hypothetical protein